MCYCQKATCQNCRPEPLLCPHACLQGPGLANLVRLLRSRHSTHVTSHSGYNISHLFQPHQAKHMLTLLKRLDILCFETYAENGCPWPGSGVAIRSREAGESYRSWQRLHQQAQALAEPDPGSRKHLRCMQSILTGHCLIRSSEPDGSCDLEVPSQGPLDVQGKRRGMQTSQLLR